MSARPARPVMPAPLEPSDQENRDLSRQVTSKRQNKNGPLAGGSEWPRVQRVGVQGVPGGETLSNVRVENEPGTVEGQEDGTSGDHSGSNAADRGSPHKLSGEQLAGDATTERLSRLSGQVTNLCNARANKLHNSSFSLISLSSPCTCAQTYGSPRIQASTRFCKNRHFAVRITG